MQVPSSLSHLNVIAPQPHNLSATLPTPVKVGLLFKPKGGYVRYVINTMLNLVYPSFTSDGTGSASSNQSATTNGANAAASSTQQQLEGYGSNAGGRGTSADIDAEFELFEDALSNAAERDTSASENQPNPEDLSAEKSSQQHPYSSITMDNWLLHMAPYIDPPHVTVRTSQMAGVGFPVDHKALLWCNQVMRAVNTYMHHIITMEDGEEDGEGSRIDMTAIVKLRNASDGDLESSIPVDDIIVPLAAYLKRNASLGIFLGHAVNEERKTMHSILSSNTLWLVATVYDTSYITVIITCYMLIPLLVIASSILFDIGDKKKLPASQRPRSDFEALMPANHLCLGILDDVLMVICPQLYCFMRANISYVFPPIFAVCIIRLVMDSSDPVLFMRRYGIYFQWVISYGVALSMHLLFLAFVLLVRKAFSFCILSIYTMLRYTVWCDFVRKRVKFDMKSLRKVCPKAMDCIFNLESFVTLSVLVGISLGGVFASQRCGGSVGLIVLYSAVCYLVLTVTFLLIFVGAILWKPKGSSALLFPTLGLYLPAVVLAKPSFEYCIFIVFGDLSMLSTMSSLFELFGPELMNYTLCMASLAAHLTYMLR